MILAICYCVCFFYLFAIEMYGKCQRMQTSGNAKAVHRVGKSLQITPKNFCFCSTFSPNPLQSASSHTHLHTDTNTPAWSGHRHSSSTLFRVPEKTGRTEGQTEHPEAHRLHAMDHSIMPMNGEGENPPWVQCLYPRDTLVGHSNTFVLPFSFPPPRWMIFPGSGGAVTGKFYQAGGSGK